MDLTGKRIVITRPRHQANGLVEQVSSLDAIPIQFPVIEINPVADASSLDDALLSLARYDWLVFTSANAVDVVWQRMNALGMDQIPSGLKMAAIGPKTAAKLRNYGVTPTFVPPEYIAEAILPGLGDLKDRWVLLPRANLARQALPEAIRAAGGIAHEIVAYHTLPVEPERKALDALRQGVDIVTFTSSSTVRNFIVLVSQAGLDPLQLPGSPLIACIGPITAETARQEGLPVHLVADEFTAEGLLASLQRL
jgi:uroporphyrinogen-III synthase